MNKLLNLLLIYAYIRPMYFDKISIKRCKNSYNQNFRLVEFEAGDKNVRNNNRKNKSSAITEISKM